MPKYGYVVITDGEASSARNHVRIHRKKAGRVFISEKRVVRVFCEPFFEPYGNDNLEARVFVEVWFEDGSKFEFSGARFDFSAVNLDKESEGFFCYGYSSSEGSDVKYAFCSEKRITGIHVEPSIGMTDGDARVSVKTTIELGDEVALTFDFVDINLEDLGIFCAPNGSENAISRAQRGVVFSFDL